MGIVQSGLDLINKAVKLLNVDCRNIRMCELGNQRMWTGVGLPHETGKQYFEEMGMEHVSLDINGLDGSLPLDLSIPVSVELGKFDIVTNMGTTEHVGNQFHAFRNIDCFCRVGGYMVHQVPLVGYYRRHCPFHYDTRFFQKLSELSGYEIIFHEISAIGSNPKSVCHSCIMVKTDRPFPSEEVFKSMGTIAG